MKHLLRTEEAAQLALAIFALTLQPIGFAWWIWPLVFLTPDLGMIGYAHSPKAGAWTYNLTHHKGIAIGVAAAGFFLHAPLLLLIGLVLFAHAAFDRMMGYGLKHEDAFGNTHLEFVGKRESGVVPFPLQAAH